MNKKLSLETFSSVNKGEVCKLEDCCREVRLGALPVELGKILYGFNTLSDESEEWKIIVVNFTDGWKSLVRRIK